jgi:hypothetical protein
MLCARCLFPAKYVAGGRVTCMLGALKFAGVEGPDLAYHVTSRVRHRSIQSLDGVQCTGILEGGCYGMPLAG